MTASIATEINIHLCKHLFTSLCVTVSPWTYLYSWFKRMMIVCVHGARDCPGYPGQSAQPDPHVGGQHDVSENVLYLDLDVYAAGLVGIVQRGERAQWLSSRIEGGFLQSCFWRLQVMGSELLQVGGDSKPEGCSQNKSVWVALCYNGGF